VAIIWACGAAVLLGLYLTARWGNLEVRPADADAPPVARYVRGVTIAVGAGAAAGALIAGAGGRLVMRLLAATSPDEAQGRLTEAEEIVGEITTSGTLGFILFVGVGGGMLTATLYMLLRRWLPRWRLSGVALGGLLAVLFATRIEPLRRDNEDFDLVGPSWLALVAFGAVVLCQGMAVAALCARYSRHLPTFSTDRSTLVRYAPLLLALPLVTPALVFLMGGLIYVGAAQSGVGTWLRSRRGLIAGRVALVTLALVALPGAVATVADIARRGP
jgi:hypothetical protein